MKIIFLLLYWKKQCELFSFLVNQESTFTVLWIEIAIVVVVSDDSGFDMRMRRHTTALLLKGANFFGLLD